MAQPNDNTSNALQSIAPGFRTQDKDGISTTSAAAVTDTKPDPPQPLEPARWFHWHEPGTSAEEKRLIFKLDFFLLSYSCLMFFIKQLDQNNISNAYVSGMSEELGLGPGNELSWMNTYFNIGTIVGGSFANLIITVVRPRFWLTGCLSVWSVFVLCLFKCNSAHQFYVLRFFIGLFESAAWPGVMYVLGSWYRKSELSRRSGLFVVSGVLGQMFSGYLQAALYTGMGGKGGLSAWRWLFIFDFILAVPVVIYGLICFPDTPHTTQAFYFSDWERQRARRRIEEEGRKPVGKMNWSVIRRVFGSWQVYAFTAGYSFWTLTCGSYIMQYFGLYLKSTKLYNVPQINNIPTCIGAVNFVFMISTGYVSDKIGRRGPVCFAVGSLLTFVYAVLSVWSVPHTLRMAVFIIAGCYGCYTPLLAGWANEACGGDQQKRAFVLGFMVSVGQAVVIPFQQLQMPSGQAPAFAKTHGWKSALAFVVALTLWTGVGLPLLQKWRESRVKVSHHESEDDEA
ncbi:Pantothenate transporter liz1-like protein 13 [Colletotrichum chlorophyti]|uniref:Pantothenate transporter liz1-like protein 13 n=1 Tax=Colletotrichum chlorophyti TaxID=708187 RepID=A0A1Q8RC85_9PEZI|nr:Pantothenate transporter liz1-like protein 13 [Colletotrichum chlorophyti]